MIFLAKTLLVFALIVAFPTAAQEGFRSSDILPSGHPMVRAVAMMSDRLQQRSNGRLYISNLGANDNDSDSFTVAQVRNGSLDMARVNINALSAFIPGAVVPTLPFLFSSMDHKRKILDGPIGQELLASLERHGLIGLCFYDGAERSLYSRTKPIRTIKDLDGLKVGVRRGDRSAILLRSLGADPIPIPLWKTQEALRVGAVDAAEGDIGSYVATGSHRVAPYLSLTRHTQPPSVLIFSARVWRTLSMSDQQLIQESALESVAFMRSLMPAHEAVALATAQSEDAQIVGGVDRNSFKDAFVPLDSTVVEEARLHGLAKRIREE